MLLFGDAPVTAFGPLAVAAVRDRLFADGLARSTINGAVRRIRRAFRWAASRELVPAGVPEALANVDGLRAGRTPAWEAKPAVPVDDAVVEAMLGHLPEALADMFRVQRLTGMRPGEVCSLRACDLDRSRDFLAFRPGSHKTEHHGRQRAIFIGPKGQAVLLRYLARDAEASCVRPCDSDGTRPTKEYRAFADAKQSVRKETERLFDGYERDLLQSQPNHVEVLVEKNTVFDMAVRVTREFQLQTADSRRRSPSSEVKLTDAYSRPDQMQTAGPADC